MQTGPIIWTTTVHKPLSETKVVAIDKCRISKQSLSHNNNVLLYTDGDFQRKITQSIQVRDGYPHGVFRYHVLLQPIFTQHILQYLPIKIGTPYLLTVFLLKFEIVHSITR